jgi:hypothetical protein
LHRLARHILAAKEGERGLYARSTGAVRRGRPDAGGQTDAATGFAK